MVLPKEWVIGFIEGEGNFNVALSKNYKKTHPNYPFEYYPILQFRIFLREDDLETLNQIKDFFNMGKIYKKKYDYSRSKGWGARDQYAYYITSFPDLLKLKDLLLSSEFYTKKKRDREAFFKILDLKASGKHLTAEGNAEMLKLAQSMNSQNRSNFQLKVSSLKLNR